MKAVPCPVRTGSAGSGGALRKWVRFFVPSIVFNDIMASFCRNAFCDLELERALHGEWFSPHILMVARQWGEAALGNGGNGWEDQ